MTESYLSFPAPEVRRPRSIIKVAGVEIASAFSWEVDSNTFYEADTFRATIAVRGLPEGHGVDWWYAQDQLDIEIFVGFPADPENFTSADLESIFYGQVEDDEWRPNYGTIDISGRDLTSELIDAKTSETYPNLTSSEIASKLAAAHGLTPVVTATSTKAGKFYQIDTVRQQDERTEWDLLTWLAKEEGFIVFVQGRELHFRPKPTEGDQAYLVEYVPPVDGAPQAPVTDISLRQNRNLARDIKVTVKSWNSKKKQVFTKTAQLTRNRNRVLRAAGRPVTPVQEYSYTIPNLTPEQAQQRANKILEDLSRHERVMSLQGPADNALQLTHVIKLAGTGTAFDQTYYPDSIVRSGGTDVGFRWSIIAKNHSPESEVTL